MVLARQSDCSALPGFFMGVSGAKGRERNWATLQIPDPALSKLKFFFLQTQIPLSSRLHTLFTDSFPADPTQNSAWLRVNADN
jgi:hypothetical protein